MKKYQLVINTLDQQEKDDIVNQLSSMAHMTDVKVIEYVNDIVRHEYTILVGAGRG